MSNLFAKFSKYKKSIRHASINDYKMQASKMYVTKDGCILIYDGPSDHKESIQKDAELLGLTVVNIKEGSRSTIVECDL